MWKLLFAPADTPAIFGGFGDNGLGSVQPKESPFHLALLYRLRKTVPI